VYYLNEPEVISIETYTYEFVVCLSVHRSIVAQFPTPRTHSLLLYSQQPTTRNEGITHHMRQ